MKYSLMVTLMISLMSLLSCANSNPINEEDRSMTFLDNTSIIFSELTEAKELLATSDEFTKSQSPFDFASKTNDKTKNKESDYLNYASDQALEWTKSDIAKAKDAILSAEAKIRALNLNLKLPKEIKLVKSSCLEEGGAQGYTRSNYIVLIGSPDEHLFVHELFHVYSRFNPEKRDALYETIAFQKCNRIEFPAMIQNQKITNPDAPFFEHYIPLTIDGKQEEACFVTLANAPYESGSFFNYLELKLMLLEGDDMKTVKVVNGEVQLHDYKDATDLMTKIGANTGYNIHPEEIMAEHFAALIQGKDVAEPSFLDAMKNILIQ